MEWNEPKSLNYNLYEFEYEITFNKKIIIMIDAEKKSRLLFAIV